MAGTMIEFQSNGKTTQGYLSIPTTGKGPGLVVLQEWWGLVPHIKEVTDRFADEGFVALAPDLYHGKATKSPDEAQKLMMALNIAETEKDLRGAIEYLQKHESVTSSKIGTVGFCMGGALSLYAATKNQQVGACVVFYGGHTWFESDLKNLNAPMLGIYAEKDKFVPVDQVYELDSKLKELGKEAEIHIYKNMDHAFFNDNRPEVYNKEAATDAWQRTLDFFRTHLKA
jgi:carboxymethylenebutenolidase